MAPQASEPGTTTCAWHAEGRLAAHKLLLAL
jgi:hypothetical protein